MISLRLTFSPASSGNHGSGSPPPGEPDAKGPDAGALGRIELGEVTANGAVGAENASGDQHFAVRFAVLERDGLVQQRSERRGSGKPSSVYELAPAAEYLFPKSYGQLLSQLLEVLYGRMTPGEVEMLLREVGQRMAGQWKIPPGELHARLGAAVEVLNELGGLMERETGQETLCIRGYRCPFAAVVLEHPEVCHLAETLLTELVGAPVQEQCERTGPVPCRFVVPV